ncbi:MAG: hypothetical protein M1431_02285 [Candidatus Thermoplasmatota archaeon]|nr:hypothetical protein [Candidatus Thermoplasmatota archaeon]
MIELNKSTFSGELHAPPFKSYAIRYIVGSALIQGRSTINGIGQSEDVKDAISLVKCGLRKEPDMNRNNNSISILTDEQFSFRQIHIKGSATVLRIAVSLAASFPGVKKITMGETLAKRPIDHLMQALWRKGVKVIKNGSFLTVEGKVKDTDFEIDPTVSSQFISGLLFLSLAMQREVQVRLTKKAVSQTYIRITADVLREAGVNVVLEDDLITASPGTIKPFDTTVPGDFALSSFFATAVAINGSAVTISNLRDQEHGDARVPELLKMAGVESQRRNGSWEISGPSNINSIDLNISESPDLLPPVAVLLCKARGISRITGIDHLKYKESNRISETIKLLGVEAEFIDGVLKIRGSEGKKFTYKSPDDHRMAMAGLTLASNTGGTVYGEECIAKSYPTFIEDYQSIGGVIHQA